MEKRQRQLAKQGSQGVHAAAAPAVTTVTGTLPATPGLLAAKGPPSGTTRTEIPRDA